MRYPPAGTSVKARPVLQESGQSSWEIGGVRVSFIAHPFPLVYPLQPYRGVSLADPREIALMKAYALGRRATARDYVDLYWLLKSRVITLDEIIRHCGPKFVLDGHAVFDARLFLGQLAYTARRGQGCSAPGGAGRLPHFRSGRALPV